MFFLDKLYNFDEIHIMLLGAIALFTFVPVAKPKPVLSNERG